MTERATISPEAPEVEEQPEEALAPARRRGHWPKIAEAVRALRRSGRLPPNLRPVERDRRVIEWLKANGYGNDLPSPSALARFFRESDGSDRNG